MTAGRKPKPAVLHVVGGNASKLSEGDLRDRLAREAGVSGVGDDKSARSLPEKPDYVAAVPDAAAEWDLLGPLLVKYGIVTELDRNTFAMYCGWHAKYVYLEKKMREAGDAAYIDKTPNNFTVQSALFSALTRATEMVAKLGAKLGLAPDDRAALLRDISLAPTLQGDLFGQNASGAQSGKGQAPAPSKAQSYFPA